MRTLVSAAEIAEHLKTRDQTSRQLLRQRLDKVGEFARNNGFLPHATYWQLIAGEKDCAIAFSSGPQKGLLFASLLELLNTVPYADRPPQLLEKPGPQGGGGRKLVLPPRPGFSPVAKYKLPAPGSLSRRAGK